jgi:catechol 2,3-dioxygenase-like lactoylglutathione lyase family enzyme
MLTESSVVTILLVRDADKAMSFYRDTLGLKHEMTLDGQEVFAVRGGGLALMPDPDWKPSGRTELSFEVDDITEEIADLESRGVRFADYDLPELKTVDHIAELGGSKAAWFEDQDGNVLCLHQNG